LKISIVYAILNVFQETIPLDLAPGKDYDFLWSAELTDVLISTISVFGHFCHQLLLKQSSCSNLWKIVN